MDPRLKTNDDLRRVCDLLALVDEWLVLKADYDIPFTVHRWQNGMYPVFQ